MKILIAGAGISGLSAALCLARRGHQIEVFERAAEISEVGAGLQISPNGMHVLNQLGLGEEIKARGFEPRGIELRLGQTGGVIFDIPLARRSVSRWGAPYIHIHRADLIDCLLKAAKATDNIEICTGWTATSIEQSETGVVLSNELGDRVEGDLLVGADGIHSIVREHLHGADQPRFTGCVAWRGVIPVDRLRTDLKPPPTACAWTGKGAHAVTYYLRGGKLVNLVGVVERSDWQVESWSEAGTKEQFLEDFKGWHPAITHLIEQGDEFFRWALFDRAPLNSWTGDRIALMGDACHPMLPFLAQGAVMALEDAYVLSDCLGDGSSLETALKRYQALRLDRTAKVQSQARANMGIFHRRTPISQLATYGPMWMAGRVLPEVVHSRMDWIYGHDVTEKHV